MIRWDFRAIASRGTLPLLLLAALLAPLVPAGAFAACCAQAMPCCPERMAAPAATVVTAPIPACCQMLLPAGERRHSDRKAAVASPAPIAVLEVSPGVPEVALHSTGRAPSLDTAAAEDPPTASRSARAPPRD